MWGIPPPLYFLLPWRWICPLGNIVRCWVLGAHPPVNVLVMLIQARDYHFPSAVGVSDWQGIQFQNPFLGVCFAVYSWYQKSYLEFPWKAVWDKELDAVGLLWEIIPGGRSRGLERNGKWKERKPIQRHIIKLVTLWAPVAWSCWVSFEIWWIVPRIVRIIWHRGGDSWFFSSTLQW